MALKLGSLFFDVFARTKGLDKAEKQVSRSTGRMTKSFARLGTAIGAALSFEAARRAQLIAEQTTLLEIRIKAVSDTTQEYVKNQKELLKIANETGQAFGDVVTLFEKIKLATRELGASNNDILELTDSLNKLGVIGGASADAINNSLRQLSQSFSGGIVRAEEFNSIVENTPAIARAIADGLGVGVGQLRKMVIEGRLFANDVLQAIKNQQDEIDKRFEKIPRTSSAAWQAIQNQAGQALKIISEEIDSTKGISGALDGLAAKVVPFTKNFLLGVQGVRSEFNKLFVRISSGIDGAEIKWAQMQAGIKSRFISIPELFQKLFFNSLIKIGELFNDFFETINALPGIETSLINLEDFKTSLAAVEQEILDAQRAAGVVSEEEHQKRLAQIESEKKAKLTAIDAEFKAAGRRILFGEKEGGELEEISPISKSPEQRIKEEELRAAAFQEQLAKLGDETAQILEAHKKRVNEINKVIELGEKQKRELIKKSEQIMQRDQSILTRMRVASVQGAVDSVIGIIGEGNAKQSALGRVALGISKGLAIAEAAIALQQNIAQASKVGFPANIPLIAAAVGQGAAIISTLQGISTNPGRVNGGPAVGGFATPITESGAPEIFENARGKFLLPGDGQGGQVTPISAAGTGEIKVTINNLADPVDVTANMVSRGELEIILERQSEATINQVNTSLASGQGATSDSLRTGFDTQRNIR